ncbi:V4R domain-containing protein [Methanocaldococcus sp. 16A]
MDKELLHKKIRKDIKDLINNNPPERTLGNLIPLSIFQAVRIGVLTAGCGIEAIIYNIGKDIGREVISMCVDESNLLKSFAEILKKSKIGILEVKKVEDDEMVLVLKDCISCHNVPNVGTTLCHFEAGLIAGTLEKKLRRKVNAVEVKCCGKGDEYCEFLVKIGDRLYW